MLVKLERTNEFESYYNFCFEEATGRGGVGTDLSVMEYTRLLLKDTVRRNDELRRMGGGEEGEKGGAK